MGSRSRLARASRMLALCLTLGAMAIACSTGTGTPPDVPVGRFVLQMDGVVADTVRGAAHIRMEEGDLAGLELNVDSLQGVSIELEPLPTKRRTYEVVDWELMGLDRPGEPPGMAAFLELPQGDFRAVDGTLTLTYHAEDQVGATFDWVLEGTLNGVPGDLPSLSASGTLWATPLSSE